MGPAIPDLGNLRFPEGRPAGDLPPFDLVIFEDNGTLRSIAPDLLGLPDALVPDAQIATLVFTDWPDPFTTPPSEPTYRMVAPWLPARDAFFWPLSTSYDAYPPLAEWNQRWRELFCTQSDGSVPRDDVFYSSACAQ